MESFWCFVSSLYLLYFIILHISTISAQKNVNFAFLCGRLTKVLQTNRINALETMQGIFYDIQSVMIY